ncbi:equilibrative nucleoside transporter 4 isoform X2 [Prionailurus viverrinus]|uniref:equilibrative nucleoside transporter 4 isoform X2 n=1 Tax=Prionailurus viverrinus TaxID=61388 RepID=UPI001FF56B1D|nr:equilibrative nucleoside transporter 4 isoform X2 [Prionailurus viverrinus]
MGSVGSQRLKEPSVTGTPDRAVVTSFGFDGCQLEEEVAVRTAGGRDGGPGGAPVFTDSAVGEPVPDDRYHAIYFAMLLAGVGFLLPYNSFITDVDYLHHKYPGTSIVFDMSLTYILVALVAVLLNNVLVERLNLHTRITAGYLLALGPLLFISICDVWLQLFSHDQAYAINLAAVGTVALGCTVQQSSFYGYTGMLPKRYTQGVMTGESTAGVMVSLSRILTKLLLPDERASTLIFFLVSAGLELLCFLLHLLVRRSRFVLYHTARPRDSRPGCRAGYRVHHDVAAGDVHFVSLPGAAPPSPACGLRHAVASFGGLLRSADPGAPRPRPGQQRVPEGQPGPRGDQPRRGGLHALRCASAGSRAQLALLQSPAAAPLRRGPRHLGRHAVHRRHLLHHAVPVPGSRVRGPPLRLGRVAAHPHHGRVQPLRLRGQDPGSSARGLEGHPPAGLLLPACGLHPPLHPVRLPQRHARPAPPGLALRLLSAHGHQQRLLWQRAHDPGGGQSEPQAAGAGGEHHDRVLHDGADAGLRRGLLHLQPHPGRLQYLLPPLHQHLRPRRPLSRARARPPLPPSGLD